MAKILIVDDSPFAGNIFRLTVEGGEHEVVGLVEDPEQALKLFESRCPDLVILDYLMPNKDGIVVLGEIIRHTPDARVIMVSGSGDHDLSIRARQAGAKLFLEKPYTKKDLLKAVDQVMKT